MAALLLPFVLVLLLAVVLLRRHASWNAYLRSLGVAEAPRNPLSIHKMDIPRADLRRMLDLGRVWTQKDGFSTHVFIAEPDLIKEVLVKHFDCFLERQWFNMEERHTSLIDARTSNWRSLRKALSPTFTTHKLKTMMTSMEGVADAMIAHLRRHVRQNEGQTIDIKPVFQGLSLDTIANCAFGVTTNSFENPSNELFAHSMHSFTDFRVKTLFESVAFTVTRYFPVLEHIVHMYGTKDFEFIWQTTKDIAEARPSDVKRGDFIDKLKELHDDFRRGEGDRVLNENLIFAQGIGLFLAGFETTSNALATLAFNLAQNGDVQDRVYSEVQEVLKGHGGVIDHNTIAFMPYLEACINENIRICPPVTRFDRWCMKDCQVGSMRIRKGTIVQFPVYAMHHNPDLYPDPETFDPDRFFDRDHSADFSFLAFGGGPRQCIGMRFAMAEIKIAMAKLVSAFRIEAVPGVTKIDLMTGDWFLLAYPEIRVRLVQRA